MFPHATNHKTTKIWQEEVLVILSQKIQVPVQPQPQAPPQPDGATPANQSTPTVQPPPPANGTTAAASTCNAATPPTAEPTAAPPSSHVETRPAFVPICAIESSIYTIPSTSCSLVYVSKVDTTGLASTAISPTRTLVSSFLSFHLAHPPHGTERVRVHVFARAEDQYLFPGSIENPEKHRLDDKGLLRWWKATIAQAAVEPAVVATVSEARPAPQLFYLVPRLSYAESLSYLPAPTDPNAKPVWTYGHPYSTLSSPLHPASSAPSSAPLPDHIPAFPDDPKARCLMSLASSTIEASGKEGDYDDFMLGLASAAFTTGQTSAARAAEVEQVRDRERGRLVTNVPGGVEEWWELMAYRQECGGGVLVGFFVIAGGPSADSTAPADAVATEVNGKASERPKRYPGSLAHPVFTKLWTQFHNADYARPALAKLAAGAAKWTDDVRRLVASEVREASKPSSDSTSTSDATEAEAEELKRKQDALYRREVCRELQIDNPAFVREKREAPAEPAKVNTLAPRKKKKV